MCRLIRSKGLTWIEVIVVLAVLAVLGLILSILLPIYQRERRISLNVGCRDQLSNIGKAMLSYANDYDGALPQAGGEGTRWGAKLRNWSASSGSEAFGLDPNSAGGEATISASLYLLVRHNGLSPRSFICPADKRVTEFRPQKYGVTDRGLAGLWDFGPDPARHCSYAYQMVYSRYRTTYDKDEIASGKWSTLAIAADRNPWIDSPFARAADFAKFMPDWSPFKGTREQAVRGNTIAHKREGQNVLFIDGHVEFATRAYCSIDDDNIYTVASSPAAGDMLGTPPKLGSQPANRRDSLLVNDPPSLARPATEANSRPGASDRR